MKKISIKSLVRRVSTALLSVTMLGSVVPTMLNAGTTAFALNAEGPTEQQIENARMTNAGYNGKAKIIDGDLYVWGAKNGSNHAESLGITEYTTPEGTTSTTFPIPYPVKVPSENFDSDVIQVVMNWGGFNFALTKNGTVYQLTGKVEKVYESPSNAKIVYLSAQGGRSLFAKDENNKWYSMIDTASATNNGYYLLRQGTTEELGKFAPIGEEYYEAVGNRTIKEIVSMAAYTTLLICEDGTTFAAGGGGYWHVNTYGMGTTAYGQVANLTEKLGGVKFVNAASEDVSFTAVDTNGNVWGWGCDHTERFRARANNTVACGHGYANQRVDTATKFYDATIFGKKAMRTWLTGSNAFILCDDNSIYATGKNTNGMINAGLADGTNIYNPTQIFKKQSEADTIVGLSPTVNNVTIYTLKGDSYFTGSNSNGAAGNGTTASTPRGEVEEVIPDTLPPSKPYTANEMSFEIEMTQTIGNQPKKVTYVPAPEPGKQYRVMKTIEGQSPTFLDNGMKDEDAIAAGQIFKLNVYFNDFGKLHTFLVPIRFDAQYVQVVNGAGEAYSTNGQTVSAVGKNAAVEKLFTNETWNNGTLASGVEGGYPKVNNKDGWVSVLGYSTAEKARIDGKQAMFSIKFSAIGQTGNAFKCFEIATASNAKNGTYDVASKEEFDYGAYWSINNPNSESQISSYVFEDAKPIYYTSTVSVLKSISLDVVFDNGSPVDNAQPNVEDAGPGDKAINNKNTEMVYTVKVKPNPEDASFPQVNWTISLEKPIDGTAELADFISIVEQKDTYVKFKLPDNFSQTQLGQIKFHAVAKKYSNIEAYVNVYVKSFDPPEFIHITEKNYSDNTADAVPAKEEFIYQHKNDSGNKENRQFTVTFPTVGPEEQLNKQVVWQLFDQDGYELDQQAEDCPVRIVTTTPASDGVPPSVMIQPLKTTGDAYVTLKVYSLYDPNVYDTVRIKVQFMANAMQFKQDILRLPTDMSRDLMDLLEIGPQDVYATNLEWSYKGLDDGPYIIFNGTSNVVALDQPTPINPKELYEEVTVKDTISGLSATIKIAVIDLDSPLSIDDIVATNNLGESNDWVQIAKGLELGDIVRFYKTYDASSAFLTVGPLVEVQVVPNFPFPVQGLLESGGGEIAVSVERQWGDSPGAVETSKIPVVYDPEPSKVYGYVTLEGRSPSSAQIEGIRVDLNGISHDETVYTDADGRFQFQSYIKPGTYSLTVSRNRYLTRTIEADKSTGYAGLVIPAAEEFCIASKDAPIKLYAGDVNMDKIIDYRDLDTYVKNWVGQINPDLEEFNDFDFYDQSAYAAIGTDDINLVLIHYGWVTSNYANWAVPKQ